MDFEEEALVGAGADVLDADVLELGTEGLDLVTMPGQGKHLADGVGGHVLPAEEVRET